MIIFLLSFSAFTDFETPAVTKPPTPPISQPEVKPIESSLSEMSLKSGMSELRNDIHLGLHDIEPYTHVNTIINYLSSFYTLKVTLYELISNP